MKITSKQVKNSKTILSEADYKATMLKIEQLMNKGSENVSKEELVAIRSLALQAQDFEKQTFIIEPPSTFAGIIEMRMYEMKLKQSELAKKLHISDTKLSLIMSGKQKPDISFLRVCAL